MSNEMKKVEGEVTLDVDGFISGIAKFQAGAKTLQEKAQRINQTLADLHQRASAFSQKFLTVMGATVTGATALAKLAEDSELQYKKYARQLDLIEDRAKKHREAIKGTYHSGIGEDEAQIMDTQKRIYKMNRELYDQNDDLLQAHTKRVVANIEAMGAEGKEYIDAMDKTMGLLKNDATGKSASQDEAMAFLNTFMNNVNDPKEEFLDNTAEYTTQFNKWGASIQEMYGMGLLMNKHKVYSLDKGFDAIKEIGLMTDNLSTLPDALKILYDYDKQDKVGQIKLDKKIEAIMQSFMAIEDDQTRNRTVLKHFFSELLRQQALDATTISKKGVTLFAVPAGEEVPKDYLLDLMKNYVNDSLGKLGNINFKSPELNEKAMEDAKRMEAAFRQLKDEFKSQISKPLYDLFVDEVEVIDEKTGEKIKKTQLKPVVKEMIGILKDLLVALGEFIKGINEFADENPEGFSSIMKFLMGLTAVAIVLPKIIGFLQGIGTAVEFIAGILGGGAIAGGIAVFGEFVLILGLAAAIFATLYFGFEKLRDMFPSLDSAFNKWAQRMADTFYELYRIGEMVVLRFPKSWEEAKDLISDVLDRLWKLVKKNFEGIIEEWLTLFGMSEEDIKKWVNNIEGFLAEIPKTIESVFNTAIENIKRNFNDLMSLVFEGLERIQRLDPRKLTSWEGAKDFGSALWEMTGFYGVYRGSKWAYEGLSGQRDNKGITVNNNFHTQKFSQQELEYTATNAIKKSIGRTFGIPGVSF